MLDGTKTALGVQACTLVRVWGTNGVQVPQIHPKYKKLKRVAKRQLSLEKSPLLCGLAIIIS